MARPSSSRPSSRKKSIALPRSSTTIPTLSMRFSVICAMALSAENDVGGVLGGLMLGHAVAERRQVDPGEHRFALSEQDGGECEVQFVDQPGEKILAHRLDATADLHVATIGGKLRLIQGRLNPVGHEEEGGAAFHLDRIPRIVG